jgi:hypothetical protein
LIQLIVFFLTPCERVEIDRMAETAMELVALLLLTRLLLTRLLLTRLLHLSVSSKPLIPSIFGFAPSILHLGRIVVTVDEMRVILVCPMSDEELWTYERNMDTRAVLSRLFDESVLGFAFRPVTKLFDA